MFSLEICELFIQLTLVMNVICIFPNKLQLCFYDFEVNVTSHNLRYYYHNEYWYSLHFESWASAWQGIIFFCILLHIHPPITSSDVNRFFAFVFKKHVLLKKYEGKKKRFFAKKNTVQRKLVFLGKRIRIRS